MLAQKLFYIIVVGRRLTSQLKYILNYGKYEVHALHRDRAVAQYIGLCPFLVFVTDFSFLLPISCLHYNRCIIVSNVKSKNVNRLRKIAHFCLYTSEWHSTCSEFNKYLR